MDPEEKKAAETAAAEEAKKKADAEAAEAKAKEDAEATKEPQIDYAAELVKEKAAREKAEKELAARRFKESKEKREEEEEPGTEDKPLTTKDLEGLETRLFQKAQKELQANRLSELANELAQTPAEADLILEIHKNRTFPSHLTLDEQIQEAYAIANGRKSAAKITELARALRSKDTASRMSGSAHQDSPMLDAPKLSSAEATALKDAGMVWDGTKRAFKKGIQGGKKFYYFDPKTKKRWTEV